MRKKIKKYTSGGWTAGSGFSGTDVGKGLGAFGGMAGGLIENADMKDGYMSTGGALGSGVLKGVSMGAAFGPMGMLLGAGLGAAGGLMKKGQINDAEDARQKAIRDEERLRANIENQMKHQQMNQVLDQFPVKGNNTPRFAMGGPTGKPVFGEKYHAMPNYGGSMDPNASPSMDFYYQGQKMAPADFIKTLPSGININDVASYGMQHAKPTYTPQDGWSNAGVNDYMRSFATSQGNTPTYEKGGPTNKMGQAMKREDSLMENILEFVDPTGITSYDDAYRAYQTMQAEGRSLPNFNEFVDMLGAVPLVGKVGKVGKAAGAGMKMIKQASQGARAASGAGRLMNAGDTVNDIYSDNVAPAMTKTVEPRFAIGGDTMGPGYEVEGGEMVQYKQGDRPATYGQGGLSKVSSQEFEVNGPSHANGGVKASDDKGARVYSNKLTVDPELMTKLNAL